MGAVSGYQAKCLAIFYTNSYEKYESSLITWYKELVKIENLKKSYLVRWLKCFKILAVQEWKPKFASSKPSIIL